MITYWFGVTIIEKKAITKHCTFCFFTFEIIFILRISIGYYKLCKILPKLAFILVLYFRIIGSLIEEPIIQSETFHYSIIFIYFTIRSFYVLPFSLFMDKGTDKAIQLLFKTIILKIMQNKMIRNDLPQLAI